VSEAWGAAGGAQEPRGAEGTAAEGALELRAKAPTVQTVTWAAGVLETDAWKLLKAK
jgi:hypothetical protein